MTSSDLYDEAAGGHEFKVIDRLRQRVAELQDERNRLREINQEQRHILNRIGHALSVEAIEDLPAAAQSACDERERLRRLEPRDTGAAHRPQNPMREPDPPVGRCALSNVEAGDERERLRRALVKAQRFILRLTITGGDDLAVLRAIHDALGEET